MQSILGPLQGPDIHPSKVNQHSIACRPSLQRGIVCRQLAAHALPQDDADAAPSTGIEQSSMQCRSNPRFPVQEDWRAYRAYLVSLEKSGGWWPSHNISSNSKQQNTPSQGRSKPAQQQQQQQSNHQKPHLLWQQQQELISSAAIPPSQRHNGSPSKVKQKRTSQGLQQKLTRPARPSSRPLQHPTQSHNTEAEEATHSKPQQQHASNTTQHSTNRGMANNIWETQQQCWAHPLVEPEVGSVLVARSDCDAQLGFFQRAVVLITSHDSVQGTVGLVLNKTTPLMVQELNTKSDLPEFLSVFGEQRLRLGGPVRLEHVTLLHRYRGLTGASYIAEGLYTGGLPAAIQLIQAGLAAPSNFTLCLGTAGWAPGQLKNELAAGCWYCVAAAPDLLLPPSPTPIHVSNDHNDKEDSNNTSSVVSRAEVTNSQTSSMRASEQQRVSGQKIGMITDKAAQKPRQQQSRQHSHKARKNSSEDVHDPLRKPAYPAWQANNTEVPALQPPPQHPNVQDLCLWRRVLHAAQLL